MAVAGAIAAGAAIISAGAAVAGTVYGVISGEQADDRAAEAARLAREQARQNAKADLLDAKSNVLDLETQLGQNKIDQLQANANISSYQDFLDRYSDYFTAQTTAAQASVKETELSGKAQYDSLMDALGYSEALAGATGRVAAGSSMAAVSDKAKENVVDYVGSDMTLDVNGGLYGLTLTAKNEEYQQLLLDLEAERKSAAGNLDIWSQTLSTLQETQGLTETALTDAQSAVSDLEAYVDSLS